MARFLATKLLLLFGLKVGPPRLLVGALVASASLVCPTLVAAQVTVCGDQPLTDANPEPQGQFGCFVSVQGDLLAVSANLDDARGKDSGSVTPYHRDKDWERLPELAPSDLQAGDQFGFSISISGDTMAVGAPFGDSGRARDSGTVYIFRWNGSGWVQEGSKLEAADAAQGDRFGLSASLSGDTLVVGAPFDSDAGSLSGSAYVFERSNGSWSQKQKLTATDGRPFDNFGFAVSIDKDTIVVGAPFTDNSATRANQGTAYVFQRDGGAWNQKTKLLPPANTVANAEFGSAVAIRGDTLAVGARGNIAGSVHVFHGSGAAWTALQQLTANDGLGGDLFGVAVSLDATKDRLLIGARLHNATGTHSGAAYLFERPEGASQWTQVGGPLVGEHTMAGDELGQSVAISGDDLVLGAYLAETGGKENAGTAVVCSEVPHKPILMCMKTGPTSVAAGATVTYMIEVLNKGTAAATGVTLNDPTPPGLTFVPSPGNLCGEGFPCSLDNIEAGGSRGPVKVTFRVPAGCSAPSPIRNKAIVKVGGAVAATCKAEPTSVLGIPQDLDLAISITGPTQVGQGDEATYTLVVTHTGAAMTGVKVTIEVTGGTTLTPTANIPCVANPGGFTCDLNSLSAGRSPDPLELKIRAHQGCPCPPSINLTATVTANEKECNETNNQTTAQTKVSCVADLAIVKPDPASPVQRGGQIDYTLKITNNGPDCACNVSAEDLVPPDLSPVLPVTCPPTSPNLTHCVIGKLCKDEMRIFSLKFKVSQTADCDRDVINTATVADAGGTTDPDLQNNSDMAKVRVACCNLAISKTVDLPTAMPGQILHYTIVVSNPGSENVAAATVTDLFPTSLFNVRWCRDTTQVPCTPSHMGDLHDMIPLAAGASATYRAQGIVDLKFIGPLMNTASVAAPNCLGDSAPVTTIVGFSNVKAFCTDISGQFLTGSVITKRFLLINGGPFIQMDNPGDEFTDILPPDLTLTGVSADSGTTAMVGNTATWNGTIPVGGMVMITITATINASPPTLICNQAQIAFDTNGDGLNDKIAASDDPNEPGMADPCCFRVLRPDIPALSIPGLLALALLLAGLAVLRLRGRSP